MLAKPPATIIIRIPISEALNPGVSHAVGHRHIKEDAEDKLIPAEDSSGELRTTTRLEGSARGSCKDNG